jgi:hypothetical protein
LQEEEISHFYEALVEEHGALTYKAFTTLMAELVQESDDDPDLLLDAFREMAQGKVRAPAGTADRS